MRIKRTTLPNEKTRQFIVNVRAVTKGYTGKFEKDCGVCVGYLARAEHGQISGMGLDIAIRMAEALGCSIEELTSPEFQKQRQIAEIDEQIATLTEQREELAK